MSVLVHINGHQGVGKYAAARLVATALGARLLDNSTVTAPAFAVHPDSEPERQMLASELRDAIYAAAANLPVAIPLVLTNVLAEGEADSERTMAAVIDLAAKRGARLVTVTLDITDSSEHRRRLEYPVRAPDKLTNWALAETLFAGRSLMRLADGLEIDTTELTSGIVAARILASVPDVAGNDDAPVSVAA